MIFGGEPSISRPMPPSEKLSLTLTFEHYDLQNVISVM